MKKELEDIKEGGTWSNLYDFFWVVATVRYTTYEQLKTSFQNELWRTKCATPNKIAKLVERGYFNQTGEGVIKASSKAIDFLKTYSDKNTGIIKLAKGQGKKESLTRSEVLLGIMKEYNPHAVFFPEFHKTPKDTNPFLIPDGAVVLKDSDRAKLIFLEVESEKPNWQSHLEGKKYKYELLAQDKDIWAKWWKHWCERLHLKHCSVDEFCFSVWCYGEIKNNWSGWEFKNEF